MPDWNALRRRAYQQHQRLRIHLPPDALMLPTADDLLQAAEIETEVTRQGVPAGDALLAGAHAVLDRDIPGIWYATGAYSSPARQRFAQAHEFAHFWLHPEIGQDACLAEDTPDAFAPPSLQLNTTQSVEGYSSKERREAEANLFAAELLLPGPVLRKVFLEEGWSASRIADAAGLSLSCVLSQLATALLSGEGRREEGGRPLVDRREGVEAAHSFPPSLLPSFPPPDGLDASQRAAARIARGPVLVDAGPGTGKTRTLIARILFLLTEGNVAPENILALTFSNKAAEEMRTRLRAAVGDTADRVWIGTFHAFGMELLRKEGGCLGLSSTPELIDMPTAIQLLEAHVDRLHLRHLQSLAFPIQAFPDILECISRAKDELKTPYDYAQVAQEQIAKAAGIAKKADADKQREIGEKSLEVAQAYRVYQELIEQNGMLDYGDLLMRSVELLDRSPEARARWQAQYPHVLADEYQDINRASAQLVQRLAGEGRGLWAVGDLRQAIYRFRGASPANVREFDQDFPGAQRVQLERNYRSLPPLVAMFGAYAGRMAGTTATFAAWEPNRDLPARSESLPAVTLAEADDEDAQADGLVGEIQAWERRGVPPGEQVILCHTHRQATRLSELLGARGVETQHSGGLFDRAEVKDLLALLSVACEPEGTGLWRVAHFPQYAIPEADVLNLLRIARQRRATFPAALTLAQELGEISPPGRAGLLRLMEHLRPYLYHGSAWALLTGYLFETSGYLRPLLAENTVAGRQKLLAVQELLGVTLKLSKRFEMEENAQAECLAFLRYLLACGQEKSVRAAADDSELGGVRLMTVHRSKGLEFPVVYVPNLVKGQFPPGKVGRMVYPPIEWTDAAKTIRTAEGGASEANSEPDAAGSEAECLFFVALSRARDALVLSRPRTWNGKPVEASFLLQDSAAALDACGARRVAWQRVPSDQEISAGTPIEPTDLLTLVKGGEENIKQNIEEDIVLFKTKAQFVAKGAGEAKPEENSVEARTGDSVTPAGIDANPAAAPLTVSATAAEQYQRCPRQYYYQRVLKLPEGGTPSTYLAFHQSWQEAVNWLQTERAEGRSPSLEEAQARLDSEWQRQGGTLDNAHGRILENKARGLVAGAHQTGQHSQTSPARLELTAELEHGNVRVSVDHAEETPEGELRLVDYKTNRDDSKDHLQPRLALARHAATQAVGSKPVQIALGYLDEGEHREVKANARLEPARVEKYNEALKGIRAERFAPNPGNECARCPFYFICPL